jgi:hypothetical protein
MTLRQTIKGLVDQSRRTHAPARVRLARGLTVSIKVVDDVASVQLSRADVYPATQEWRTVLDQWPGQYVVVKPPKPLKDSRLYYLIGQVRLVPDLIQEGQHE